MPLLVNVEFSMVALPDPSIRAPALPLPDTVELSIVSPAFVQAAMLPPENVEPLTTSPPEAE